MLNSMKFLFFFGAYCGFQAAAEISAECNLGTVAILENAAVVEGYKNAPFENLFNSDMLSLDETTLWLQYSTLPALEQACVANQGTYFEWHFEASCKSDGTGLPDEYLEVINFPVCYSKDCGVEFLGEDLLKEFTFERPAELNLNLGKAYTRCFGSRVDIARTLTNEWCEKATSALGNTSMYSKALDVLNPDMDVKAGRVANGQYNTSFTLNYTDANAFFAPTCEDEGGRFITQNYQQSCSAGTMGPHYSYNATNVPVCVGNGCTGEEVMYQEQVARMVYVHTGTMEKDGNMTNTLCPKFDPEPRSQQNDGENWWLIPVVLAGLGVCFCMIMQLFSNKR